MTEHAAGAAEPEPGVAGRLELSGPAAPQVMELVHAPLETLWAGNEDVPESDRVRFETSVIEIVANIVEHAYALDDSSGAGHSDRRFDITVHATPSELVATLADNGLPMPLDLGEVTMPDELAESGRGLALATAMLDDLQYERVDRRNRWTLLCRRSGG